MAAGETVREAAVAAGAVGLGSVVEGAEEIGSAGALADTAEQLAPKKRTSKKR